MSKQIVGDGTRGKCFPQGDIDSIVQIISCLLNDPLHLIEMLVNGRIYSKNLTLESWQTDLISQLLEDQYKCQT